MYIDDQIFNRGDKTYRRVLLRHGTRISPKKTKLTTIATISDCSDEEIDALKFVLRHKSNLSYLENLENHTVECSKIYGTVLCLYQVAQHLGIVKFLGKGKYALHILWLIFARLIDKSSRLSAVRLANVHAGCEVLGIHTINEDILYKSLDWLEDNKSEVEKKIYQHWKYRAIHNNPSNQIFLYDLSSSYFEGTQNELSAFGYNRDKKKGKKIITYGLLTDQQGEPLGIEVFPGNTSDNTTVKTQLDKIKEQYGAKYITFVGDKGMIKSKEIKLLEASNDSFYITSITKRQIDTLIKKEVFQLELFDKDVCEIEDTENKLRYVLRKNPYRAEDIEQNRNSKISEIEKKIEHSNIYLKNHKKAKVEVQVRNLNSAIKKLKLSKALKAALVSANGREVKLMKNIEALNELSKFDGCYVIKTNLPKEVADKETIHDRYKDLAYVEQAFKESKSLLDARPIYVRKAKRTIAHVVITMLAYKIEKFLRKTWSDINMTPIECLQSLSQIGANVMIKGDMKQIIIQKPNEFLNPILKSAQVTIPSVLPFKEVKVHTNKNLVSERI